MRIEVRYLLRMFLLSRCARTIEDAISAINFTFSFFCFTDIFVFLLFFTFFTFFRALVFVRTFPAS